MSKKMSKKRRDLIVQKYKGRAKIILIGSKKFECDSFEGEFIHHFKHNKKKRHRSDDKDSAPPTKRLRH